MPFDIWNQATNTRTVQRAIQTRRELAPKIGQKIAPLTPTWDRKVKMTRSQIKAVGMAPFRAPQATPAIYTPMIKWDERMTELFYIDEFTPIEEELWNRLTSRNDDVKNRAGLDMVKIAQALQIRNEVTSEWMIWQALKNTLVVNYPNYGQAIEVLYDFPAGHHPTELGDPWTTRATSDPIATLRAWQEVVADSCGEYGLWIHMNSNTFMELVYNAKVRAMLTPTSGSDLYIPSRSQIERLLIGGDSDEVNDASRIIISNAGFRDESAGYNRGLNSLTKYMDDGEVLITTADYTLEGEPIAEMLDGRVAVVAGFNNLVWKQGAQSEVLADHEAHGWKWRQASSRIPRLIAPEAILWGTGY